MHIGPTTHEHRASAKVYSYEGDFDIGDREITWEVDVTHADEPTRRCSGAIPLTSPAAATLAEESVRDAVVREIDRFSGPTVL